MADKIFLIHWNDTEAHALANMLKAADYDVAVESSDGARAVKAVLRFQPNAVVIYLTYLPSHGRETAIYIHKAKASSHIPIIFLGGDGEALEKTKAKIPDAIYINEDKLIVTLSQIIKRQPQ